MIYYGNWVVWLHDVFCFHLAIFQFQLWDVIILLSTLCFFSILIFVFSVAYDGFPWWGLKLVMNCSGSEPYKLGSKKSKTMV